MSVISKEKYERLKLLPEEYRSNEQREAMVDFERAEAQAPTMAQVRAAVRMHNTLTKNPSLVNSNPVAKQKLDEALKIIEADRAYTAVKGNRVNEAYVQPVKRIPDDLINENEFNFNWKSAYENTKGEKLRDTEADYDKLKKFIDSNMYNVDDPVNLQKIAYDLHMYNPNTMKWTGFINSEQGEEFKKYIADVRENQRKKSIEKIFSGEEPTKVNYPLLGPTDVPGSNALVDFGIPVAKENAKQALLKNEEPNVWPALTFDVGTNAAMMGGGKLGLIAPPVINNAGQYIVNDEEPVVAGVNTLLGVGSNVLTPFMLRRGGRYLQKPGAGYSQRVEVQGTADAIANKVDEISSRYDKGALQGIKDYAKTSTGDIKLDANGNEILENIGFINDKKKILFTDNAKRASKVLNLDTKDYKIRPLKEAGSYDKGIISENDMKFLNDNQMILRQNPAQHVNIFNFRNIGSDLRKGFNDVKKAKELRNKAFNDIQNPDGSSNKSLNLVKQHYSENIINSALDKLLKGKKISDMELKELYGLGYNPKESLGSFLLRLPPDNLRNYMTNFMGRKISGGATMTLPQMFFGTNLNKFVEEKKKDKPKISEIFGGE